VVAERVPTGAGRRGRISQFDLLTLPRFARRCHIVSVTEAILARAGRPFPVEPIRALDAIHLATAEALGEPPALVIIITRGIRVRENSIAPGFCVE